MKFPPAKAHARLFRRQISSHRHCQFEHGSALVGVCLLAAGLGILLVIFFRITSRPIEAQRTVKTGHTTAPSAPSPAPFTGAAIVKTMTVAQSGPSEAEIEAWLGGASPAWPSEEIVRAIILLDDHGRIAVLEKLAQALDADPDKLEPFVEKLVTTWFGHAPGPAILFLDHLHIASGASHPALTQLESKLMNEWIGRGLPVVGEWLQQQSQRTPIPETTLDLLTRLLQNEQKAGLSELLKWVDSLEGGENRDVRMAVFESLARTSQPENFAAIAASLEKNLEDPRSVTCIDQFAARSAAGSPEETVLWLEKLAPQLGSSSATVINDLFDQLGRTHPEIAVRLINSGFTDKFASSGSAQSGPTPDNNPANAPDALYDLALSKVLNSVMILDPQYALTCAEYFNNPQLQDHFTKTARHLLLAGARQKHQ